MDLLILCITIIIGAIKFQVWRNTTYLERHGLLHTKTWPFIGTMAPIMTKKYHFFDYIEKYYTFWPEAKYVGFQMFTQPAVMVRDVELIKTITVKNFDNFMDHDSFIKEDSDLLFGKSLFALRGSKWRDARTILSPAFTASKMKMMFELMEVCAKEFTEFYYISAKNDSMDVDIKEAFQKYTNDVIATCAFGISVNSLKNPENKFYTLGKSAMKIGFWQNIRFLLLQFIPILSKIIRMPVFSGELSDFFLNTVKDTIETRKKEGIVRPDMIQLMLEAVDTNKTSFQMDLIDMTAQAFIFFVAGFDTASSLMSFTALQLAMHQDIQDRLLEEIHGVMDKTDGKPTYDAINSMPYLEAVLYETLRYFPIAGFLERLCVSDFEFPPALPGLKPFMVKKGMHIWIPMGGIHKDPKYYENPEKYNPDRFFGQKMSINMPTYLGFGIGPRSCIGNRFALLENKLVLFHFLTKFKCEISSKLKQPIEYSKRSFSLTLEGGFWVKIVPRDQT